MAPGVISPLTFSSSSLDGVFSHRYTKSGTFTVSVTVTTVDERALRGKATCKGLQWFDALDVPILGEPPDTGAPKFDAEITFEATS